jgi:SAM-dependent methyltransferase
LEPIRHWDQVARHWRDTRPQRLWRAYSDVIHSRLLERWLPREPVGRILKTDVFDELAATGLAPLLAGRARTVVGMDVSEEVLRGVAVTTLRRLAADARRLPFPDACFDRVVSNSTLDHFGSVGELATALGEIARVLRPGGELLLTLDNLANPVVALRNALPARALLASGLIPYRMGASCGPTRLKQLALAAGLTPLELGTLLHCPRLPAVATARLLAGQDGPRTRRWFFGALGAWEALGRWPTRFLTGYFLTLRARRPAD